MKRLFTLLLTFILCLVVVGCGNTNVASVDYSVEPEKPSFMYSLPEWLSWGMKEGEVRQKLGSERVFENGNLIYVNRSDYRKCDVTEYYGFTDENSLIHMSYHFSYLDILYDDPNPFYDLYSEFKYSLTQIYGEPAGETDEWKNERYKGDEYMLYKAIEEGDYTAMTAWDLDGYICYIQLDKGISINYEAKKQ